jgi:hypothetical protein
MEMIIFRVGDAVKQGKFNIKYYPGKENLGDYQNKHHIGANHTAVCLWYLHKPTSDHVLPPEVVSLAPGGPVTKFHVLFYLRIKKSSPKNLKKTPTDYKRKGGPFLPPLILTPCAPPPAFTTI